MRQEDIALGVNDQLRIKSECAPQAYLNTVTSGYRVVGVELQRALAG
jgi:hypothetical protein